MASTLEKNAVLSPVLSDRYALKWQHAAFCCIFAILFLLIAHSPLPISGPWQHLRLGALGGNANAFGLDDPSVPLSAGMHQPRIGWLTSSILATVQSGFGDEGISQSCAVVLFAAYLVWARCFFLLSRSKRITAACTVVMFAVANWQFGNFGPATFGFFGAGLLSWSLLHVIRRDEPAAVGATQDVSELGSPHLWWFVPLLMMVWCNLSGTFLVGIVTLLAVVIHCAVAAGRPPRSVRFFRDRRFQQSLYLLQLSLLATCFHPQGLKLWAHVFAVERNPFWLEAGGRLPVELASIVGVQLMVGLGLALWIFRTSSRKIAVADIVTMATLLVVGVFNGTLFAWLTPMFLLFAAAHLAKPRTADETAEAQTPRGDVTDAEGQHRPLQFAFSLICLLIVWMGFSFSPLSTPILGGAGRSASRLYSAEVPWQLTRFLAENSEEGLVWAPSYWSDWIGWKCDRDAKLFSAANVATLPAQVRRDYERVYMGDDSWDRTLGRYAVHTLVIDKSEQERLLNVVLREGGDWRIVFESKQAIVLRRKREPSREGETLSASEVSSTSYAQQRAGKGESS